MVKVLFLQNVENHNLGDIKNVPDGYARNYLVPQKIAVYATKGEVEKWQAKINKMKSEEEKTLNLLHGVASDIESKTFKMSAQAGDEDKLYGAVTNKDLAEILEKAGFKEIDRHSIEILEPIHELGEHEALIKLGHGIHAKMKLVVEREK